MIKELDFDLINAVINNELPIQTCNMCGKKFDEYDFQENCRFDHRFGYGSKYDFHHLDLNLCCKCTGKILDWLLPQCTHDPMTYDPEPVSFPPADDFDDENLTANGQA